MSIDLNWETLTTGPDGEALAHSIRDFIHTKFQSVPLPRFIKSVTVHDFEFGTTPPELELKDITDPLPDFYEENPAADDQDSEEDLDDDEDDNDTAHESRTDGSSTAIPSISDDFRTHATDRMRGYGYGGGGPGMRPPVPRLSAIPPHIGTGLPMRGISPGPNYQDLGSPFLGTSTPGIPGGTSNLNYFHSHLTGGLSGTQTPLAAVAGAQLGNNNNNNNNNHYHNYNNHHPQTWSPDLGGSSPISISTAGFPDPAGRHPSVDGRAPSHSRNPSQSSISVMEFHHGAANPSPISLTQAQALREKSSVSTFAPTTSSAGTSRPATRDNTHAANNTSASASTSALLAGSAIAEDDEQQQDAAPDQEQPRRFREPRTEDIQAVFRIKYSGDVKLLLTADILLDYPMPSFVGIPLRLSITGLSFDGVGVVAYIRKRVHFCFLSPDDALAAIGADENDRETASEENSAAGLRPSKMGGLLQEIRVESEIGQREGGKQSLKNVGKVERFVLEQVRRIFEEEFVYPSFWTFLV